MDLPSVAQETERPCLSTGRLSAPEVVRKLHPKPASPSAMPMEGIPSGAVARRSLLRSRQPSRNEGDT